MLFDYVHGNEHILILMGLRNCKQLELSSGKVQFQDWSLLIITDRLIQTDSPQEFPRLALKIKATSAKYFVSQVYLWWKCWCKHYKRSWFWRQGLLRQKTFPSRLIKIHPHIEICVSCYPEVKVNRLYIGWQGWCSGSCLAANPLHFNRIRTHN